MTTMGHASASRTTTRRNPLRHSRLLTVLAAATLAVGLGSATGGCEGGFEEEIAASDEEVGEAVQELGVPRLWPGPNPDRRHFGGNILEEDHYYDVGGPCSEGYVRSANTSAVKTSGNGACELSGWNSENPYDCSVEVHAHTNAFWGGLWCETKVYEERAAASCGRRGERCGGVGSDGACFCDPSCELFGDCCFDYNWSCQ